jgi:pilus assembly protein CpaB
MTGFGSGNFSGGNFGRRRREKMIFLFASGIAVALLVIIVVVFVSKTATANKAQSPNQNTEGTVTLYTSDRIIPAGSKITENSLKLIYCPINNKPLDAITDIKLINGKYANKDIGAGQPILTSYLSDSRENLPALEVRPGMRAVTIDVDAKRGLEGWALPGTQVDVVLTYNNGPELMSKIVVENGRVLSTGGDSTSAGERLPSGRRQVATPNTVTIEVNPTDALKLETAAQLGKLSLHLRSNDDSKAAEVESFGSNELQGILAPEPKKIEVPKREAGCQKGKIKIEGKDYILDCDGNIRPAS